MVDRVTYLKVENHLRDSLIAVGKAIDVCLTSDQREEAKKHLKLRDHIVAYIIEFRHDHPEYAVKD